MGAAAGLSLLVCAARALLTYVPAPCCVCTFCFLQLCDGATPEERARWLLQPPTHYTYLNQSDVYTLPGVDNAQVRQAAESKQGSSQWVQQRAGRCSSS
jgi:hypothetical protein